MKQKTVTDNWHTSPTEILSRLTNRPIFVNNSDRYCVLPTWNEAAVTAASRSWRDHLHHLATSRAGISASVKRHPEAVKLGYSRKAAELIASILQAPTGVKALPMLEEFVLELRQVLAKGRAARLGGTLRFTEFLFILWKHRLIAFPASHIWALSTSDIPQGALVDLNERLFGDMAEVLRRLTKPLKHSGQPRALLRLVLACSKPIEVGDIDYGVLQLFRPYAQQCTHVSLVFGI